LSHVLGGDQYPRQGWTALGLDEGAQRAVAAMCLLGCRQVGGRAYPPMDHYGSAPFLVWLRSVIQTGALNEKELNELESAITLSSCDPDDYVMNNIGSGNGIVGGVWSGRHSGACMLTMVEELDYVLGHCRLDDRTRKEVERRYDGLRKTVAAYIRRPVGGRARRSFAAIAHLIAGPKLSDDVLDPPQLLGARQVDVLADKRRVADRGDLAHDVDASVFRVDPHEHILQERPHEAVRVTRVVSMSQSFPALPLRA